MDQTGAGSLHRIAVALRVSDRGLRDRLARHIDAGRDFSRADRAPVDVVIADLTGIDEDENASVVLLGNMEPPLPRIVRAVLPIDSTPEMIVDAARLVAHGLLVLPDSVFDQAVSVTADEGEDDSRPTRFNGAVTDQDHTAAPVLTPREQEVLQLLAAGASNKLIARRLDISVHTAKFHVASLLRKLGASGRAEAIGIGLRSGLLMI
jgi:DNA-binding NarL/FixJ family response regulator